MPQFFIEPCMMNGNVCIIRGDDYEHLTKVRRVKKGDRLDLRTEDGMLYAARIIEIGDSSLSAEIIGSGIQTEGGRDLTVYISLLKGKLFDDVIRQLVEIGAAGIVPVITERTVADISKKEKSKYERWRKIALEASKQSMRGSVPAVGDVARFNDAVKKAGEPIKIIAHTGGGSNDLREYLRTARKEKAAALLIGPEGGFSEREVEAAKNNGWQVMTFGHSCMRAETAAVVLPAILIYEWGISDEA